MPELPTLCESRREPDRPLLLLLHLLLLLFGVPGERRYEIRRPLRLVIVVVILIVIVIVIDMAMICRRSPRFDNQSNEGP